MVKNIKNLKLFCTYQYQVQNSGLNFVKLSHIKHVLKMATDTGLYVISFQLGLLKYNHSHKKKTLKTILIQVKF